MPLRDTVLLNTLQMLLRAISLIIIHSIPFLQEGVLLTQCMNILVSSHLCQDGCSGDVCIFVVTTRDGLMRQRLYFFVALIVVGERAKIVPINE